MDKLVSFLIIGIIAILFFGEKIIGTKCPVCGSKEHWKTHYWGMNKDYDDFFCSKCYKALYNPKTNTFTEFALPQNFK